ncbi:hypothetical protein MA16_Dca017764 [Dendrobium catenatum]|uniref:Uncharacterized protein n=1 Tax=Dendrobium catenatum TaxID=906689 RepID=A0A2I0XII4_9ASPA|nr:hypothetical protein MA16_Dca017764 [Dendrobium catenatum]
MEEISSSSASSSISQGETLPQRVLSPNKLEVLQSQTEICKLPDSSICDEMVAKIQKAKETSQHTSYFVVTKKSTRGLLISSGLIWDRPGTISSDVVPDFVQKFQENFPVGIVRADLGSSRDDQSMAQVREQIVQEINYRPEKSSQADGILFG